MQVFQRSACDAFHKNAPFLFAISLAALHDRKTAFLCVLTPK
ncbi:hypothetical protein SY94_4721 [Agrobacterium tumefaciens]|nr:hypothetical protein SY94_4721 [Agrobacterium tumefaciens]